MLSQLLLLVPLLVLPARAEREVFAHFILGNTAPYSRDDFHADIKAASDAGIDGFALNIGGDSFTSASLDALFAAAESFNRATGRSFRSFISFDYAAYPFTIDDCVTRLLRHSPSPAYFHHNGRPVASTFLGTRAHRDWNEIKRRTNAYFIPTYSDVWVGESARYPPVDGLLSWDAWPYHANVTPATDQHYVEQLKSAGKQYMMPVSPWFYTACCGKNWLYNSDQLWPARWQQVFQLRPDFVQLLTWNDYGESHYLGPQTTHASSYPQGSKGFNEGMVHSAWLSDLPYYIQKYKSGNEPVAGAYNEHLTFWYRRNPKYSCGTGGTVCNSKANGQQTFPPTDCAADQVNFSVFTAETAVVTVQIGDGRPRTVTSLTRGLFSGSVPFDGETGAVKISAQVGPRTIRTITGPGITNDCGGLGHVNWNPWVGGGVPS